MEVLYNVHVENLAFHKVSFGGERPVFDYLCGISSKREVISV